MSYLLEKEIQTRDFFYPLHLQPCYKNFKLNVIDFPISEMIYNQGISLPSSYSLTKSQLQYISKSIADYYL
mgnify:CR=1 FL=1